jgi:predicted PurR-regulated permease PerM
LVYSRFMSHAMKPDTPLTAGPTTAETARSYRPLALAAVTAVLIGLCVILLLPFLPALAWGVALAVIAWPFQTWMVRQIEHRHLATALTTAIVVIVIVVPGLFVGYQLAREAGAAAERAHEEQAAGSVRDKLAGTPGLGGIVGWLDGVGVNVDHEVHKAVETYTRDLTALVQGSMMGLVQFAVAMFILFHLLFDRESLLKRIRALLPMTREETDRVLKSAGDSVHANLHATLVTSVIDGVGGGVMFWLLGLPSPVTWGAVMFFLSFLPLLGTWLVWLPTVAFLAFSGQWTYALILFGWGVASSIVVDNVIYVRIAGDRMRLHQVPALLAFLGGLVVFGVSGMILGPGILAVTVAVLEVWHCRATETPLAPEVRTDSHLKSGVNGSQREVVPAG